MAAGARNAVLQRRERCGALTGGTRSPPSGGGVGASAPVAVAATERQTAMTGTSIVIGDPFAFRAIDVDRPLREFNRVTLTNGGSCFVGQQFLLTDRGNHYSAPGWKMGQSDFDTNNPRRPPVAELKLAQRALLLVDEQLQRASAASSARLQTSRDHLCASGKRAVARPSLSTGQRSCARATGLAPYDLRGNGIAWTR